MASSAQVYHREGQVLVNAGKVKKGTFALAYPLSRQRAAGVVRAEGKLLQLTPSFGNELTRAKLCEFSGKTGRKPATRPQNPDY